MKRSALNSVALFSSASTFPLFFPRGVLAAKHPQLLHILYIIQRIPSNYPSATETMDFSAASTSISSLTTTTTASSSSSISNLTSGIWAGRGRVSDLVEKLICAVVTCVFTVVGSFAGAITGGLIGLATESGLIRGAGIGAISGAVFSIEVVESSIALWHSNDSGIWSVLYVIDVIFSLLSGRLVREKVGPAVQSAVQSQMNAVDSPFIEVVDMFETGGSIGMSKESVDKLPTIRISEENNLDESGENICCSVCLQDFQMKESVRSLPQCRHMFHTQCIDTWLVKRGSCPMCRRDL